MANASGQKPTAVESQDNYQTQFDYAGGSNLVYYGKATPGTATSSAAWFIKKIAYDGSNNITSITLANGTDAFDKIWDNRTTYSYS